MNVNIRSLPVLVMFFIFLYTQELYADNESCRCINVNYERMCGVKNIFELETIKIGECVQLKVESGSYWNASGLALVKGAHYEISSVRDDYWCDASIKTDANGWEINDQFPKCETLEISNVSACFKKWLFLKAEEYRRYPNAGWFELIGVNAYAEETDEYRIAMGDSYTPDFTGEFCAYANDLNKFYGNNKGSLKVTIRRTD